MTRIEFLKSLGLSGATLFSVLATCTLESCSSKGNDDPTPTPPTGGTGVTGTNTGSNIDFTLDLNNASNANLKNNGTSLVSGDVIIARNNNGDFVALSKACTHQGTTVNFRAGSNDFECRNHGSEFNANGGVTKGPALSALKKFNTTLSGTNLRVFA